MQRNVIKIKKIKIKTFKKLEREENKIKENSEGENCRPGRKDRELINEREKGTHR